MARGQLEAQPSFTPFFLPLCCVLNPIPDPGGIPFPIPVVASGALGVPGHPSARDWHPPTPSSQPTHHKHPPKAITQSSPCVCSFLQHPMEPERRGRGSQWPLSKAGLSPMATGQLEAQPSFTPFFLPPSPWVLSQSPDPQGSFPSGCPWSARTPWLPRTGPRSTSSFLTAHPPPAAGSASSQPAGPCPEP